jgi:hypothetical protein
LRLEQAQFVAGDGDSSDGGAGSAGDGAAPAAGAEIAATDHPDGSG